MNTPLPELLEDLATQVTELLASDGMESPQAQMVGSKVADHLRMHWGGQQIYIPKHPAAKYHEIYQRFRSGDSKEHLCREYRLTLQRLYQIINMYQKPNRTG